MSTNKIECVKGWQQNLVPGQLYCQFMIVDDGEGEYYDQAGCLVYWTGVDLVYEDGEEARGDWDYLVPQVGSVNPEFIDVDVTPMPVASLGIDAVRELDALQNGAAL